MVKILTDGSYISPDYGNEVAAGRVVGVGHIHKFGRNRDINTTEEDLWGGGGSYLFATAARTMRVKSTQAADTATGTGARTITIEGLDSSYATQSETLGLKGTATATSVNSYLRVFRSWVETAGSGETAVGTITLVASTSSATQAVIVIGANQTEMAIYTIPAGRFGLISRFYGGVNVRTSGSADVQIYTRKLNKVFRLKHSIPAAPHFHHSFEYCPLTATAKTDIKITANTTANNMDVIGGFHARLESI